MNRSSNSFNRMLPCVTDENLMSVRESCLSADYNRTTVVSLQAATVMHNQTKKQKKRIVAFSHHAQVVEVPSCSRMSEEERQEQWWTKQEIRLIRESEDKANRGNSRWGENNDDDEDELGLCTPSQDKQRSKCIRACRKAVLREWEYQQSIDVFLPTCIRMASRKCSQASRREANIRGSILAASEQLHQQQGRCLPEDKQPHQSKSAFSKNKKSRHLASLSPPRPSRKSAIIVVRPG